MSALCASPCFATSFAFASAIAAGVGLAAAGSPGVVAGVGDECALGGVAGDATGAAGDATGAAVGAGHAASAIEMAARRPFDTALS